MSKVKSISGNICANVFMQGRVTKVVSMTARSDAVQSLVDFTDDVGIPEPLVTDGAGEFTSKGNQSVKEARCKRMQLHANKQGRKNQNHAAKRDIGFLAKECKL